MKKVLLILSLFLSLNNYGFNGLLNRIYGWSLRDFIFSLFIKKENKEFSMLQQTGNNTTNTPKPLQGLSFSENNFLHDEAKIKEYREKFVKYNIEKFNRCLENEIYSRFFTVPPR
jgi:hypothetical protein